MRLLGTGSPPFLGHVDTLEEAAALLAAGMRFARDPNTCLINVLPPTAIKNIRRTHHSPGSKCKLSATQELAVVTGFGYAT